MSDPYEGMEEVAREPQLDANGERQYREDGTLMQTVTYRDRKGEEAIQAILGSRTADPYDWLNKPEGDER